MIYVRVGLGRIVSRRASLFAFTGMIAGIVALAIEPLIAGEAVPHWDANLCFAPYDTLIADFARHGQLVTWNPWVLGGIPDFAEPQLGTLSPISVIVGFITGGGLSGFAVHWGLVWLLSALGVQLLAQSWGVGPLDGAVAALAYAFCGVFTGHAEHVSVLVSSAAVPFVIWRFDVALRNRSRLAAAEAGGILGLSALGGYPGLTVLTGVFLCFWGAARVAAPDARVEPTTVGERLRMATVCLAITAIVAAAVLAPSYVGFFREATAHADRTAGLSIGDALSNSLSPGALATFASPYLATLALFNPKMWADNDVSSASIYVGPLVLVFGAAAVFSAKGRLRAFLAMAVLTSLVLSLGQALPFRRWLDEAVPMLRYFRHPSMSRLFFAFSLVALFLDAARPDATFVSARRRAIARFVAALVIGGAAVVSFRATVLAAPERGADLALAQVHYLTIWIATAVLAGAALIPQVAHRRTAMSIAIGAVAFADAAFNAYLSRPITLDTDASQRRTWAELERRHDRRIDLRSLNRAPVARLGGGDHNLISKQPTLGGYSAFTNSFQRRWLDEPVLRSAATGRPRLYFAATATILPVDDVSFERFIDRARTLGTVPMVIASDSEPAHDVSDERSLRDAAPPLRMNVELGHYTPTRLAFRGYFPSEGWLLVTDRWAPGWRATVNGRPTPVSRGAFLFRAVRVPAGAARVEFRYEPQGLVFMILVSWLTLFGLVAARIAGAARRRAPH